MKLAVIGDEISQDLDEVVELARHHRFDGVEVRSVWGLAPYELTEERCRAVAQQLEDAGLSVAGFASPVGKEPVPTTAAARRDVADRFSRCVDRARALGAPHMRIFSFLRAGEPRPDVAIDALGALVGDDDVGVDLVVESGTLTNTVNSADLATVVEGLRRPFVGALWDPGNGVFAGMEAQPFPEGYEAVRRWLRHVHVKDPVGRQYYTELGCGGLPWPEIFEALRADNYTGYVSLETHWRPGRVLTKAERDQPWGEGFSAGGKEASDRCMAVMRDMVGGVDVD